MAQQVPTTVRELTAAYVEARRPHIATPESLGFHLRAIDRFCGDKTLEEICQRNVARNICHEFAAAHSGKARNTLRKQLMFFQASLRWAWKQGWIDGLPHMWIPDAEEFDRPPLSLKDREILLDTADAFPTEPHLRTYVYLALYTSQNAKKILDMTWNQVDFDKNRLFFFDERGAKKFYELPARLRKTLERADEAKTTKYVIEFRGKPVKSVYSGLKALFKRAGIGKLNSIDLRLAGGMANDNPQENAAEEDVAPPLVISYCAADGMAKAATLCDELEVLGIQCWIAPRDVKAGPYSGQIVEAIEAGRGLVVLLTPKANDSTDVHLEVETAKNAKKVILPVIVDGTKPAKNLRYYLAVPHQIAWSNAASAADSLSKLLEADQ